MKILKKAILPQGFLAAAISAGIKKSGKLDLSILYSKCSCLAACKFTINIIQAAPVKINKELLKRKGGFRGIIINSGNANCFTGKAGYNDAKQIIKSTAGLLGVKNSSILAASTGIINKRLPMDKINNALPALTRNLTKDGINKAKLAILTTDTCPKEITVKLNIGGKNITVTGIAKGAGMIAPNMATLLCFILTDACISEVALKKSLDSAVEKSFNCITIDGCMSTNDSVMVLANGTAKNKLIADGANLALFSKALDIVCLELAKMLVKDGEGATKFIRINVAGAKNYKEAKTAALSVANSNLFKTAVYGENPNFGRIAASIGSSGVSTTESKLKFKTSSLNKKEIDVNINLGAGKAAATIYTTDLTPEYIKINAEYN